MLAPELVIALIIAIALIFVLFSVWHVRRQALTVEDYVVSRNSAGVTLATATLIASGLGAWISFSPAETGATFGIVALVGYGIGSALPLVAFIVLGPRMRQLMPQGHSITEYVWHRFGPGMYVFVLLVVIFYMFIFLAAELTGIALAVRLIGDTPLWVTATVIGVLTVAYTAYGGMKASLFTDQIQCFILIPLLIVMLIAAAAVGDLGSIVAAVSEAKPELLSFGNGPGIEFGITLIIGILASEMFNQGSWQRVYTARDSGVVRKGFLIAGLVALAVIFLTGMFGVLAVGFGTAEDPSVSMFAFVFGVMPAWSVWTVLILVLVLVMSSMDTLLNGIASAVTTDLARFRPNLNASFLLGSGRLITIVMVIPAIVIAAQGYSVLHLFLIADLVCASALFPVFFGLFVRRFGGKAALVSSVTGLVVGALYFPAPDFGPWNALPQSARLVISLGAALGVSAVLSLVFALAAKIANSQEYNFERLNEDVQLIIG
jgi:Na+/proline symporter